MDYPNVIEVQFSANTYRYNKQYEHENGGCYYVSTESEIVTSWLSLYPDGHMTFLWNGRENPIDCKWKEVIA